jgi:hypothetical protein
MFRLFLDVSSRAKSLYISRAVSNFYGTEIEIWAGFRPVAILKKRFGADCEQLLWAFFLGFHRQKNYYFIFKNIVVSALKRPVE